MAIGQDEFRAALGRFASGVTVVTTKDAEGRFHGITVSAFCSVSLEPPLILVCIEKVTGSHRAIEQSGVFIVNILDRSQQSLSEHFALQLPEKFADIFYHQGLEGIPVLDDALVSLECRVTKTYDGGDHSIYIAEVENAGIKDGSPLVYFHGNYREIID
jgi:flavin reductase (DIM6/NTAB) family NADH-FMN oxidoreductase RutF